MRHGLVKQNCKQSNNKAEVSGDCAMYLDNDDAAVGQYSPMIV